LSTEPLKAMMNGVFPAIAELPKRADLQGIGLAYMLAVVAILISMWPLWSIRIDPGLEQAPPPRGGIMDSIKEGFSYVWHDKSLRAFIIYMSITTFVSMGPQMVGIPVLADDRLAGTRSYGLMMSASGIGAVLGSLFAAFWPPSVRSLGTVMMSIAIIRGMCTFLISEVADISQGVALMILLGILMGYGNIVFMTWIQKRVQLDFLGRVMSLVMLSVMGLAPLSQGFAGWFIDVVGLAPLFICMGVFMMITPALALCSRDIRQMGHPRHAFNSDQVENEADSISS
jgi:hypothetical protein